MKKHTLLFVLSAVLLFAQQLYAFNWPVDDPLVVSTFGGDKWGSYASGLEVYAENAEIRPCDDGEVIFYENSDRPGTLPGRIGHFVVVEHERKLRTLYAGIEPAEDISEMTGVTASDILGELGGISKSARLHLHFAVIDSEFGQYVNPLLLLNSIVDNASPEIRSIRLLNEAGFTSVDKNAVIKAGKTEIQAEIFDPGMSDDYFTLMAPYKIQLFHNGEEIFYLNFESLRYDAGSALIQSREDMKYDDFYRGDGYVSLGEISLVPGDSRFEILVSDYSENETGRTFQLTVIE
ncbi:MAG: peptidoglycan DD-metalloendopeptidase family protein [Spirochaetales bacterium]|uniref:Peptidoglycan DD-metalloendopeptidase family protein n=1 Tax=Candidatus Thalassospirochaeta sargassi TaxID=3119039 RepID=A0AAJ1MP09_9SPIO|nr:peptidoglycan DD-metalloendopeptidase family protein [Spirochaetales bacterium]